jgi:thioredoxin 1
MPLDTSDLTFDKDVLESATVVLVDFWAPWCMPCKMLTPMFEEISKEMKKVKFWKVNVDENGELAGEFSIQGIPAILLFKDGEEKILYSDSQFDVLARVEVLNAYNDAEDLADEVTVFNWEFDRKQFISEIANFGNRHNEDYSTRPFRNMTVEMYGTYAGIIEVEATKDKSTAFGTTWTKIDDWDTRIETTKVISETEPWRYVRFKHGGGNPGSGATFNITIEDGEYVLVSVIHRGQDYNISDILTIKGSYLGGDDGVNDLTINVNAVNEYPNGSINSVTGITWSGTAAEDGYYRNVEAFNLVSANPVDKIIVRN